MGASGSGNETARPALELASWLCANTPPRPDALTHLKLQKLEFYCYGALLALDLDGQLGDIDFQAWKHGPVSPVVYERYKMHKAEPLPPESSARSFSAPVLSALRHVVNVYGRLTAWELREESHCEKPWEATFDGALHRPIPKSELREHFLSKFAGRSVSFPERLFGGSSMLLDQIPVPRFASLEAMSLATTRILGA